MISPSISLICGTCSHDWIQDLGHIDTFKVTDQGGQLTKVYRVPCPICGNIILIESSTDSDDTPSAWGT